MASLAVQPAEPTRPQWEYSAVAALTLMVAALAVIAPWTSSQPRSRALLVGSATPSTALRATTGDEFTLARPRDFEVVLDFYQHITSDILHHCPEASQVPPVRL